MKNKIHYISEFFGTFLLVLFGTGSVIISEQFGYLKAFEIGLVFGITVWLLVHYFGKVAHCHINPAVTISFWLKKEISLQEALLFMVLQLTGALVASSVLRFGFPMNVNLGNTLPSGSWQESFLYELVLSFILMGVILISTTTKRLQKWAPFLIGFTVFLEAWLAGPICGASMNPARTFGPALVSGNTTYLTLYVVAPVVGMLLALASFMSIKKRTD